MATKKAWEDNEATFTESAHSMEAPAAAAALASPALRIVFRAGRVVAVDHKIPLGGVRVGRYAEGAKDLRFEEDKRVSRHHADVTFRRGEVILTNHSSAGTLKNGKPVTEGALAEGDVVRVGDTFMIFRSIPPGDAPKISEVRGRSPAAMAARQFVADVGPTMKTALLLGETGVGKDVTANAIHVHSGRSGKLVAVNCAAIPETLAEAQLFGHKAGAFTGATTAEQGLFREADGGTLFLDEVGELPLPLQAKLLRVLDERKVLPVGGSTSVAVDVRIIAATNRDLLKEIDAGRFRADLYARLAELTLDIAPLRERREDILLLLTHMLGSDHPPLSRGLVDALLLHRWPFNVREIAKVGAELLVRGKDAPRLELSMIEARLARKPSAADAFHPISSEGFDAEGDETAPQGQSARSAPSVLPKDLLPVPSKAELLALLTRHRGRVSPVSRATGRSRTQVYRWAQEYGIDIDTIRARNGDVSDD